MAEKPTHDSYDEYFGFLPGDIPSPMVDALVSDLKKHPLATPMPPGAVDKLKNTKPNLVDLIRIFSHQLAPNDPALSEEATALIMRLGRVFTNAGVSQKLEEAFMLPDGPSEETSIAEIPMQRPLTDEIGGAALGLPPAA